MSTQTLALMDLTDNEFLRQFETTIDGKLAKVEYSLQERKIFLTKLNIPEEVHTEEIQDEFLRTVFDEVKSRGIKLVPTNREISKFMKKNRREYRDLLPVGMALR